jgi:chromosomal replication initiation ATPase DnaA
MALLVARGCTGLTLKELGEAAGGMDYGAVSMAARRMETMIGKKKEIRKAFSRMSYMLHV